MANTTANNSWEKIQGGVKETERLIGQRDYNSAMMKARQTLEFMVKQLAERAGIIETSDLKEMIDILYENQWISKSTCEHYHKIRMIGNKAAHEGDASAYNANQAYHMLSQEVYTFANDHSGAQKGSRVKPSARTTASSGKIDTGMGRGSADSGSERSSSGTGRSGADFVSGRSGSGTGTGRGGADFVSGRNNSASGTGRGGTASGGGRGSSNAAQSTRSVSSAGRGHQNRRPAVSNRSRKRQPQRRRGFTAYDLLKLLIPILCIVLLFFVVKLFKPGKDDTKPTREQVTTEAAAETPGTEAPETEAEASVTYRTTTTLNVRPEPSTDSERIGQLPGDTVVEYVGAHDEKWAIILYEGQEAYVASQYLTAE